MPRLTAADSISTMAAPTAAVGRMERLMDTASAPGPRAKVPTPVAGTMGSRSPVSTPGLGEITRSVSYSLLACFQLYLMLHLSKAMVLAPPSGLSSTFAFCFEL